MIPGGAQNAPAGQVPGTSPRQAIDAAAAALGGAERLRLQNGRMRHQERRNDLFPFAAYGGHSFALQTQVLDGNIAYNVSEKGQATRGGDVRDRRIWMLTNPVTRCVPR